jgi:hypothetical protein
MQEMKWMLPLLAALSLCACSSQQAYSAGQSWQRNECGKIIDSQERDRCLERTSTSYDTYKQQTGAAKAGD